MRIRLLSCFASVLFISTVLAAVNPSSRNSVIESKNILFGVCYGGSTHINWVLEILDELANRGHNITFATKDHLIHFGVPFERIKTVSFGQQYPREDEISKQWSSKNIVDLIALTLDVREDKYAAEFAAFKALVLESGADVLVCDKFARACEDAASSLGLPFIVTSFIALFPDATAPYMEDSVVTLREPTTLTMPFTLRFYNRFIVPLRVMASLYRPVQRAMEIRKQAGAPPFSDDPWQNSLKIINSAFGLEPARPLGPLVEMVGPIMHQKYVPLSPQLQEYLDTHHRIVYIAFGQNFAPTQDGVELIFSALVDNLERGTIDGFVWATAGANITDISTSSISLASGHRYDMKDILAGKNSHCRFIDWAPQQALLQHPAVSVFLTHGGQASITEGLFSGVRLVVFPLVADQPFNARTVVNAGLGGSFERRASLKQASETLATVALDATGEISKNVRRYQHLVRIRSAHGALKGADLVEEVAYMHQGGLLPHRYEASRQMSYLKSKNLDLDIALLFLVLVMLYVSWRVVSTLKYKRRVVWKAKAA